MRSSVITEVIALFFVALFLYTGINKFMDFYIFREQVGLSPLLASVADLVAVILPSIEILTAIILFIPRTRLLGMYMALILMICFTGYIFYILNFNEHLPCTCGGVLESLSWRQHLVLNACLITLAFTGCLNLKKKLRYKGIS